MFPALVGLALWFRKGVRGIAKAVALGILATATKLVTNRLILGSALGAIQQEAGITRHFFSVPSGIEFIKQITPICFSPGVIVSVVVICAASYRIFDFANRRWLLLFSFWSVPGYLFWFMIRGNNVRHVVPFFFPLLWLAADRLKPRYLVLPFVLGLFIPANSNVHLFPAPNMPLDIRLLRQKQEELRSIAQLLMRSNSCIVGTYTNDYVKEFILEAGGRVQDAPRNRVEMTSSSGALITVYTTSDGSDPRPALQRSCTTVEYDSSGRRHRFLGTEWHLPNYWKVP